MKTLNIFLLGLLLALTFTSSVQAKRKRCLFHAALYNKLPDTIKVLTVLARRKGFPFRYREKFLYNRKNISAGSRTLVGFSYKVGKNKSCTNQIKFTVKYKVGSDSKEYSEGTGFVTGDRGYFTVNLDTYNNSRKRVCNFKLILKNNSGNRLLIQEIRTREKGALFAVKSTVNQYVGSRGTRSISVTDGVRKSVQCNHPRKFSIKYKVNGKGWTKTKRTSMGGPNSGSNWTVTF